MKPTILFLAIAGGVATLCAQAPEPPAVVQITRELIKEGKAPAHTRTEQAEANALRKNKFPFHYLGLDAISGANEVVFLSAYPSFAAMDQGHMESEKQPLKSEMEQLDARDGEYRTSTRGMTSVFRKDLSYLPENGISIGKTHVVMLLTYRVRIGKEDDFMSGAKMLLEAYAKAKLDTPILAYQVVAGSQEGVYLFFVPMASLKALDQSPAREKELMDAMGPDNFRQLMKGAGEVFASMESQLYAVSPEMSYVSKATEDEDPAFWRPKPAAAGAEKSKDEKPKEKTTP